MISPISALSANLGTPQRTFLWQVIFPNVIGGGSDTSTLLLRAQSTSLPERAVGRIELPFQQGPKLQFPGKLEYPHLWSCTFVEGEVGAVLDAFYGWAQKVVDDDTNIGSPKSQIISDIILQLVSTDGTSVTQEYRLIDCWLQKIDAVSLDYDTQGVIKFTVSFAYQSWQLS